MLEYHHDLFKSFKELHDKYAIDPKKFQEEFNEEGQKIMVVLRRYENSLCSKSEGGKYGKFSSNLADKYWSEIRTIFPKIDMVGVID
jgi:hypothetical protein